MDISETLAISVSTQLTPTVTVAIDNYVTVTIGVLQDSSMDSLVDNFLPSFIAILFATGIIAYLNTRFFKNERRHQTADSFCINLEQCIISYFEAANRSDKRTKQEIKYNAYLKQIIYFVESGDIFSKLTRRDKEIVDSHFNILLNLGNEKSDDKNLESFEMRKLLFSIVHIRYLLTK